MPRRNEPTTRMCAVTRRTLPTAELIRFVAGPDGEVVVDLRHRLPGRGVWVTAASDIVSTAEKKKIFARALEEPVTVKPGIADRVGELIRAQVLGALSLARKAGELALGNAKVEAALTAGKAIALVHASDASDDGVRKLAGVAARSGDPAALPSIRVLSSEEMGLALNRPHVIHAALLAGRASQLFIDQIAVLARYNAPGSRDGNDLTGPPPSADQSAGPQTA